MTELFFELHRDLPREGPGDDASTLCALNLLNALPVRPDVLDVGCGPGAQTLALARATGGRVTAVDLHQPFLDELGRRAGEAGLTARITPLRASMSALPLAPASFDLVWSEGAISLMGFDAGLRAWHELLRPGGYLVVSELTWLVDAPPAPARAFWAQAYPAMRDRAANRAAVARAGYAAVADFVLPRAAWFETYYDPLERRLDALARRYAGDAAALRWLAGERAEIALAREHGHSFGYVFHCMRKGGS